MPLISGKSCGTREEALQFLLRDRHLLLKPEVVEWFNYARIYFSESELQEKRKELIAKEVRKSFSRNVQCLKKAEYIIAAPYYKLVTSSHSCYYDFTLDLYLVASIEVEHWSKGYQEYSVRCVVIEPMKKEVEKFKLPLDFLGGISKGDLSQFERKGRDNQGYCTWHIPSLDQDVRLHGVLVKSLEDAFGGKPLGAALIHYGLADWEEGKLAEQRLLMSPATTSALMSNEAPILCTREQVEQALTGGKLGIKATDAKKALDAVFNPSLSLEENVRHCLQSFGG
jgi:hypothetical protein